MKKLPDYITGAIKSGPIPKVRNWRAIANRAADAETLKARLTLAERTMFFIESFLIVPEGALQGQPIKLDLFQMVFIYAVYDNPRKTRRAFLSMARKNAKTSTIAMLLIAHIAGPPAEGIENAQIISGAMSRDQAALVFSLAEKMINSSPVLSDVIRSVASKKSLTNLYKAIEYKAISAEASTAHGLSPSLAILDEIGQVVGSYSPFVDAVVTAQGAHENPLLIAISTSAAADADLFSVWCDDAERHSDPHTVCHVYAADKGCDLLDRDQWKKANPALGRFRSETDLKLLLTEASRLASKETTARNLLLNQRVAMQGAWLSPALWKSNLSTVNIEIFQDNGAFLGLDLSKKNDLTAAVLVTEDCYGMIHVKPYVFTPLATIDERSRADKVPYNDWARDGHIIAVPGKTIDYEWVARFLKKEFDELGIEVLSIEFDRWRIDEFRSQCERVGFGGFSVWHEVGQGFKDQSPRVEAFETALLQNKMKIPFNPALNLGASSAIAVRDPAGNVKLDKKKAANKIDVLVALVMAAYPALSKTEDYGFDVAALLG